MLDAENVEEQEEEDDEEEIEEDIEEQVDVEDDDGNVIGEEPEGEEQKKFKQMLKYVLIIQYYKLPINEYKFVSDESYLEEYVNQTDFKECLKKFDEEENVEIEGYEFINNKLQIKYKGKLSREYNIDFNKDINNSIAAEGIPVVVNDKEVKVKRKRIDEDQEIIENSITLTNKEIPPVVDNNVIDDDDDDDDDDDVISVPIGEVPPAFKVI
jgi:hypothetical protein